MLLKICGQNWEKSVRKHNIRNRDDLKIVLQEEWGKITSQVTQTLVDSMPRRLEAVLKAKGYATKY